MSDRFEKQLKNALRPVDPGPDFLAGVMRRVQTLEPAANPPEGLRRTVRARSRWLTVGLAASLVAAVGIVQIQERREEAEGQRARQQLLAALHVTSEKLNLAYRVVNDQPDIEIEDDATDR